jgi:hypothetical protein
MALRNDDSISRSNGQAIRRVFMRARREEHPSLEANDVRKTVEREFSLMEQAHARIRAEELSARLQKH